MTVLFGMGFASPVLINDTPAIIGTPLVLLLAKECRLPPKLMLLTLAFAVTIESAMNPIGNPQNVLITINGNVTNAFVTFPRFLFVPTVVNLFLAFIVLKLFYRKDPESCTIEHHEEPVKDKKTRSCKFSLILIAILIVASARSFGEQKLRSRALSIKRALKTMDKKLETGLFGSKYSCYVKTERG